MFTRRLWAYENWLIVSMYSLFLFLTIMENEIRLKNPVKIKLYFAQFRYILAVNIFLLVIPWGLFLLLAPVEILSVLRLSSFYWKILGIGSLFGAMVYYFPYRFYNNKLSYYIFIFGIIDNFIAGGAVTILFIQQKVPLFVFTGAPLLFYFAYFFLEQVKRYQILSEEVKRLHL